MKAIVFSLLVTAVTLLSFIPQNELSVEASLPSEIKNGENFDINLAIYKTDYQGFVRIKMKFPEEVTISGISDQSAVFSFVNHELTIVWMEISGEKKINVKLNAASKANFKAAELVNGSVIYIDGNEKVQNKITLSGKAITNTEVQNETTPQVKSKEALIALRNIPQNNLKIDDDVIVQLNIENNGASGIGKIVEKIPAGFKAEEINANGANFTFAQQEVKFLWLTIPSEKSFKVSYRLIPLPESQAGNKQIVGSITYLEQDQTKQSIIVNSNFTVKALPEVVKTPEAVVTKTPSEGTPNQQETPIISKTQPEENTTQQNLTVTQTEQQNTKKTPTETVKKETPLVSNNEAISYRVQICATRKPASTDYFVQNHQIKEKIYLNMHQGWHKFTVGGFNVYKDARDHREQARSSYNITNPFVTAYNKKERITVQEALMISKQNWVP